MRPKHLVVVAAISVIATANVELVTAQEVRESPSPAAVLLDNVAIALGRICASEEGLSRVTPGCAAIYEVYRNAAERRGIPWMRQAREGSSQSFNRQRTDARRWIAFLEPTGSEPQGWPQHAWRRVMLPQEDGTQREMMRQVRHAAWSDPTRRDDFRRRWLRLYEHSQQISRGEVRHQCTLNGHRIDPVRWGCPPDTFTEGSCRDHVRAERAGWIHIDCGEGTRNWFYCDPRIDRDCRRPAEPAVAESEPATEESLGG